MTVKRYTPIAIDAAFGMECDPEGQYVTYSDYQKLVAENAELKSIISDIGELSLSPAIQGMCEELKLPATDAAIAEIRGKSVIIGIDFVRNMLIDYVEREVGPNKNVPGLIKAAEKCVELAANLRAGRKG